MRLSSKQQWLYWDFITMRRWTTVRIKAWKNKWNRWTVWFANKTKWIDSLLVHSLDGFYDSVCCKVVLSKLKLLSTFWLTSQSTKYNLEIAANLTVLVECPILTLLANFTSLHCLVVLLVWQTLQLTLWSANSSALKQPLDRLATHRQLRISINL